jgi:hypothetical protein
MYNKEHLFNPQLAPSKTKTKTRAKVSDSACADKYEQTHRHNMCRLAE